MTSCEACLGGDHIVSLLWVSSSIVLAGLGSTLLNSCSVVVSILLERLDQCLPVRGWLDPTYDYGQSPVDNPFLVARQIPEALYARTGLRVTSAASLSTADSTFLVCDPPGFCPAVRKGR